jgi:hypothetical protein
VKEITAEVNRVQEGRDETMRFSPEKVGDKLKSIGLPTRRLSQIGNGLTLDRETTIRLHEVAVAYGMMEDLTTNDENIHCHLCHKNE